MNPIFNQLLPCRKCGSTQINLWNGLGTQAQIECNDCGNYEHVQVTDCVDRVVRFSPENRFDDTALQYSQTLIDAACTELVDQWNQRYTPPRPIPVVTFEPWPTVIPTAIWAWTPHILYGEITASPTPKNEPAVRFIKYDKNDQEKLTTTLQLAIDAITKWEYYWFRSIDMPSEERKFMLDTRQYIREQLKYLKNFHP